MAERGAARGPVFVVGFPRSGTTLVQQILNAHPQVAIAPETHFFHRYWRHREQLGDLTADAAWARLLTRLAAIPELSAAGLEAAMLARRGAGVPRTLPAAFRLVLDTFAELQGATVSGEKTPANQLHTPVLQHWFPDALFIHVVRDPRAAVSSWRRVHWSSGSVAVDALEWRRRHRRFLRDAPGLRRAVTIRYEDLVRDPEPVVREFCAFLGIDFHRAMLEHSRRAAVGLDLEREPWKARATEPMDSTRTDAWRGELTGRQVLAIEAICGRTMTRFEYRPVRSALLRILARPPTLWMARFVRGWQGIAGRFQPGRDPSRVPRHVVSGAYNSPNPYGRLLAAAVERADPTLVVEAFRPRAVLRTNPPVLWHMHWPENVSGQRGLFQAVFGVTAWVVAVIVARRRRVPILWTVHNTAPHEDRRPWLTHRYMQWLAGTVDGWISLTSAGAEAVIAAYPALRTKPRAILPHGHYTAWYGPAPDRDSARAEVGIEADDRLLVCVGRIRPYKNVPSLVAVFRETTDPRLRLLVAGRSEREDLLLRVEEMAEGDGRVSLRLGHVPDHVLTRLLAAADGFVLPADELLNSGSALLALSYGVPVLVPDTPVMRELQASLGPTAVHMRDGPLDSDQLVRFAGSVRSSEREAIASAVRSAHDWGPIGEATSELYSTLIRGKVLDSGPTGAAQPADGWGTGSDPASALVSVIIPTRDRPHQLRRAIAAVLAQRYAPLELIVVDDASGPETARAVAEAAGDDPRVRLLRHESIRGAAIARNTGATAAAGQYLLFEDDDCEGDPARIAKLVRALENAPDAAFAYCRWRLESDGEIVTLGLEGPWGISTPCALIRAECFRDVGGFDPELPRLQDFDLWTRLLAKWQAVEVPEVLFEMHRGGDGISVSDERLLVASSRLLFKYGDHRMPTAHVAAMHRRLGGKLLLAGFRKEGVAHFLQAVRRCGWCARSWLGLAAALAGPGPYRALVRILFRVSHWDAVESSAAAPLEAGGIEWRKP